MYEESPKASYIIVQQLIWREFFYVMSTNNPFYDEIGGFYAASNSAYLYSTHCQRPKKFTLTVHICVF